MGLADDGGLRYPYLWSRRRQRNIQPAVRLPINSLLRFRLIHVYRHAMLVDQKTEGVVVPLNEFLKSEGRLELANSTVHAR